MSVPRGALSDAETKQVQTIVKFGLRAPSQDRAVFRAQLFKNCMDALNASGDREANVAVVFDDAYDYFHRPTEMDHFRESAMQVESLQKRKTGDSSGPRKKTKARHSRTVTLGNRPMSPARSSEMDWNQTSSSNGPRYTAYRGTLNYEYSTLNAPPSPTRTDAYPTVSWNPLPTPPPINDVKHVPKQTLDPERLKLWKALDRRGFVGQGTVMNGYSADQVALNVLPATEVMKAPATNYGNSAWEWLHLVSFKMGGIDGSPQQAANLVAGTYECNSLMISIEEAIKDLVLIDKLTLGLEVIATCFPGTHLGTNIDYKVFYKTTDKGEIEFICKFNPLVHINPGSGDKDTFKKALKRHFGLER